MGRIAFFLSEAFRALRRSAAPSVAAIVTIVVTTLLLGVLVPVLRRQRVEGRPRSATRSGSRSSSIATRPGPRSRGWRSELAAVPHVDRGEFCSPDVALKELAKELEGDLKGSISELNSNPLPPSFKLELDDPDNLEAVRAALLPPNSAGKPTPISAAIDRRSARTARTRPRSARSRAR